MADLHTESSFLSARDCILCGTLHSEDTRNDGKNDEIKIRIYIYNF